MLMYFKESKHDDWVGTILLSGGQVQRHGHATTLLTHTILGHPPTKQEGGILLQIRPPLPARHSCPEGEDGGTAQFRI